MTMETRRDERIHKLTQALKRTDKLHLKMRPSCSASQR